VTVLRADKCDATLQKLLKLIDSPSFHIPLTDSDDPRLSISSTETHALLPHVTWLESAATETASPKRMHCLMDSAEPMLEVLKADRVSLAHSRESNVKPLPNFVIARRLREDPKCELSSTEQHEPTRVKEKRETSEPTVPKHRNESCEAIVTPCRFDNVVPTRDNL
jgi:hypothetical protein